MKASAKDLRFHSKEILDAIARGEEVIITYRGNPHALMTPIKGKKSNSEGHRLFGIWKDNDETKDVDGYVRQIKRGRF